MDLLSTCRGRVDYGFCDKQGRLPTWLSECDVEFGEAIVRCVNVQNGCGKLRDSRRAEQSGLD